MATGFAITAAIVVNPPFVTPFAVDRSIIVALPFVAQVVRGANETADLHLRGRSEVLPVSRNWLHRFRQM